MLSFSDLKLGKVINFNDQPCVIIKCDFLRKQQGKPVKKCVLRNLVSGANLEYSFKSGESVEEADLRREYASYMYGDAATISFMLSSTYETVDLSRDLLDDKADYLKEGLEVVIVYFNDGPISIELPLKVSYEVIETADVEKGNTVNNVMKDAKLETGKVVKVPAFIKVGEKVIVNTVEDEYSERDNS